MTAKKPLKNKQKEKCEICKNMRGRNEMHTIKLLGSKVYRRICIQCLRRFQKNRAYPAKLIAKKQTVISKT